MMFYSENIDKEKVRSEKISNKMPVHWTYKRCPMLFAFKEKEGSYYGLYL